MTTTREVLLVRRPEGPLRVEDLSVAEVEVPRLEEGQVLVRNTHHSVDAALRLRLDPTSPPGYLPAFAVGEGLAGLAVGTVLESRLAGIEAGDIVQHARGYRGLSVVDGDSAALGGAGSRRVPVRRPADDLGPARSTAAHHGEDVPQLGAPQPRPG